MLVASYDEALVFVYRPNRQIGLSERTRMNNR